MQAKRHPITSAVADAGHVACVGDGASTCCPIAVAEIGRLMHQLTLGGCAAEECPHIITLLALREDAADDEAEATVVFQNALSSRCTVSDISLRANCPM